MIEIVKKKKGFHVLPRRWVVERTFAWLNRYRRLSKDYERKPTSSQSHVYVASIRLMLRRIFKERAKKLAESMALLPATNSAEA
ncbi:transposase (fragment) [Candidatus Contendobacter odensis Run_B_J11]|uniref:Transposase n=1 Tax=Candidatus Contendobacter odensis Run_B_J11 TaxID=1400861 RepID=A0A7U7GBE9_9GAMM